MAGDLGCGGSALLTLANKEVDEEEDEEDGDEEDGDDVDCLWAVTVPWVYAWYCARRGSSVSESEWL